MNCVWADLYDRAHAGKTGIEKCSRCDAIWRGRSSKCPGCGLRQQSSNRDRYMPRLYAQSLLRAQGVACRCCGDSLAATSPGETVIDHDHSASTRAVRGIVCRNCNLLLGHMGDSLDEFERRVVMIRRYLQTADKAIEVVNTTHGQACSAFYLAECRSRAARRPDSNRWTSRMAAEITAQIILNDAYELYERRRREAKVAAKRPELRPSGVAR